MLKMPAEFEEVVRISDAERMAAGAGAEVHIGTESARILERVRSRQMEPLSIAMDKLDDDSFRKLMGWVLFGREYSPEDGDPHQQLAGYIRNAAIRPREDQSAYLEEKPIGKYLRLALQHLSGETASTFDDDDEEE
jgi:hypothetical protein